ncbi:MAG: SBBP repeat-containing protein [Bacteroidetes bacterium]|nr:SBBP repeat-containing protein [Bacteroidota bacterium]
MEQAIQDILQSSIHQAILFGPNKSVMELPETMYIHTELFWMQLQISILQAALFILLIFDPGSNVSSMTTTGSFQDAYILKLDSGGNYRWSKQLGGSYDELAYSIALDASANVYTTGVLISSQQISIRVPVPIT